MRVNSTLLLIALLLVMGSYLGWFGFASLSGGGLIVGEWNNPSYDGYDFIIHVQNTIPSGYSKIAVLSPTSPINSLNIIQCNELGFEWLEDFKVCKFKPTLHNFGFNNTIHCNSPQLANDNSLNSGLEFTDEGFSLGGVQDSRYSGAFCEGDIIVHIKEKSSFPLINNQNSSSFNVFVPKNLSFLDSLQLKIENFFKIVFSWFNKK